MRIGPAAELELVKWSRVSVPFLEIANGTAIIENLRSHCRKENVFRFDVPMNQVPLMCRWKCRARFAHYRKHAIGWKGVGPLQFVTQRGWGEKFHHQKRAVKSGRFLWNLLCLFPGGVNDGWHNSQNRPNRCVRNYQELIDQKIQAGEFPSAEAVVEFALNRLLGTTGRRDPTLPVEEHVEALDTFFAEVDREPGSATKAVRAKALRRRNLYDDRRTPRWLNYLIDTNLLVRALDRKDPDCRTARDVVRKLSGLDYSRMGGLQLQCGDFSTSIGITPGG
jgi:Arc/MetJ-type ribon-helix-helix transcriptional regulator